jgi:hypothetical protein
MIPKNLLTSGTALFYIVVDAGLLPIRACVWESTFHLSRPVELPRFGTPASGTGPDN